MLTLRKIVPKWPLGFGNENYSLIVGVVIIGTFATFSVVPQLVTAGDPLKITSNILSLPSSTHIFGTDSLGRDIFTRIVYGARVSLLAAILAVSISASVGPLLGLLSGYKGGKFDSAMSVPMDALYAFPSFILALITSVILGGGVMNISIAVGIARIPTYYRMARSITVSLKEQQLVESERALGAGTLYVVFTHIFPMTLSSLIVLISVDLGNAILIIAGLGFLGFGVPPPTPEWGTDLGNGRIFLLSGSWWPVFFPGLCIFLLVLGFNSIGEWLNVKLNPKQGLA